MAYKNAVVSKKAKHEVFSQSANWVKHQSYASGLDQRKDPLAFITYMSVPVQIISSWQR